MTGIPPSVVKMSWGFGGKAVGITAGFPQNVWSQPIRHLGKKADFVERTQGIITGPPGSGKGTVSERLVRDFKLSHISSGDLLRHHIMSKTGKILIYLN